MRSFSALLLAGIGLLFACGSTEARPAPPEVVMPTMYQPCAVTPEAVEVPLLALPANTALARPLLDKPTAAVTAGAAIHSFLSSVA